MKKLIFILLLSSTLLVGCTAASEKSTEPKENTSSGSLELEVTSSVTNSLNKTSTPTNIKLTSENIIPTTHISLNDTLYFVDTNTNRLSISDSELKNSYLSETDIKKEFEYYPNSLVTDEKYIYFNNISENNSLYRLNVEDNKIDLLSNNSFSNMILYKNTIYYLDSSKNNILCSYNLKNNTTTILSLNSCSSFILNGNYILYNNASDNNTIYSIRLNGDNDAKLIDTTIDSFTVYKDNILYIDQSNNNLYYYNMSKKTADKTGTFTGRNLKSYNDSLYYIDPANHNYFCALTLDDDFNSTSSLIISNNSTNDYDLSSNAIFLYQGKDINQNHFILYNE